MGVQHPPLTLQEPEKGLDHPYWGLPVLLPPHLPASCFGSLQCYCSAWRHRATVLGIEKNILYNSVCFPKNYDSVQLFFLTGFCIIATVSDKMLAGFGANIRRTAEIYSHHPQFQSHNDVTHIFHYC